MELSKNSKINQFLYWYLCCTDWNDMPKTLCSYFWMVVFTISTSPITFIGMLECKYLNEIELGNHWILKLISFLICSILSGLLYGLFLTGGYSIMHDCDGWGCAGPLKGYEYITYFLVFILVCIITLIAMILCIFLIYHLFSEHGYVRGTVFPGISYIIFGKKAEQETKPNILLEYIRAIKEKACPIIKYK